MMQLDTNDINARRNEIKRCPCCNGNIEDRTISLYTQLIVSLYKVCQWCQENKTHEFMMKDIKHLLGSTEYTRFGDLVRFGGLVYKKGKADYGVNMERAREFFRGETQIPLYIVVNQITNEVIERRLGYIHEIKNLKEWLNKENKLYIATKNPYKKI